MERFSKDGKLIIPLIQRKGGTQRTNKKEVRHVVTEAYCPNGCNIIDEEHKINGFPGLRVKYRRTGVEGAGVKDELYCPHCSVMFKKLVNCSCKPDADMVVIGLTPKLDYNNAISFCNVTGCRSGTTINAGDVIRHVELWGTI
ncbi:MAG: hypothetical protein ACYSYU_08795 [Planctomycetota bacterium]|jgi:hypothetical protein